MLDNVFGGTVADNMWKMAGSRGGSSDSGSEWVFFECDGHDGNNQDNERMLGDEGAEEFVTPEEERVRKLVELRWRRLLGDEERWRESVRQQMELELNRRVREALQTPPLEGELKHNPQDDQRESPDINAHLFLGRSRRDRRYQQVGGWGADQGFKLSHNEDVPLEQERRDQLGVHLSEKMYHSNPELRSSNLRHGRWSDGSAGVQDCYSRFPDLQPKVRRFYTKDGYVTSLRSGDYPIGVEMVQNGEIFVDKYGVARDTHGPFWPADYLPMFATPRFKWWIHVTTEPLDNFRSHNNVTVEVQVTSFKGQWRGVQVAYDSDRSPRDLSPLQVPDGCCPTLMFESRFECGNLRQARRVGQFEYELILKTDLYTTRHTQWYYFRVTNASPGVTYKLRIINLLKRDSLYNHGMRPLMYSELDARVKHRGWVRVGHHISYTRTAGSHNCSLLDKSVTYHTLEWQMEFPNASDTYYLAHCYPYSFTDLKEDLELLMNNEDRSKVTRREVMCETRAGNCCFLLTVTNFDCQDEKKAVVVTARVHPGESQASWMMKGLLEFITGSDPAAQKLRNKFVFKVVPMINPDGVIVGNYRCSLAARDLNRNYRHPRQESFPTIWYIKNMVNDLSKKYEIALYCDLHGHSRKQNVFMYGNNPSTDLGPLSQSMGRAVISDRLFPWIMSVKSPDKFHFQSCKFKIRRCKESTGRVVMWRQMSVICSFTMEASFSGTVLNRENCRHFNIKDFMDMGKVLAEAVLEYQAMREDPVRHAQAVLGLTRTITEQVLISRGLLKPGMSFPTVSQDVSRSLEVRARSNIKETAVSSQGHESSHGLSGGEGAANSGSPFVHPCGDVNLILQRLSGGCTLEDCVALLEELDVQQSLQESDSSDSDSESEAELKTSESKTRKKRRKSKKQRDKDKYTSKKIPSTEEKIPVEDSRARSALPSLSSASCRLEASNSVSTYPDNPLVWPSKQGQQAKPLATSEKCRTGRSVPVFVSKYEGRHNGGLPCFTEERSQERAAQKIAVQRRREDAGSKTPGDSLYWPDEGCAGTQEFENHRPHDDSDDSRQLNNVRTGYTHADSLDTAYPNSIQLLNSFNSHRRNDLSTQSYHHSNGYQDMSSISGSDNIINGGCLPFPLATRKSPYNQLDQIYPRPVSEFEFVRHSYITQNRSKSVTTTATSQAATLTSPTSTSVPATTLTKLHPGISPTGLSSSQNINLFISVNSLSTAATTTKSTPGLRTAEFTNMLQDLPYIYKTKRKDYKMEPFKLSRPLLEKHHHNKDLISSDDLIIVNKSCRAPPKLEDVDTDAKKENSCHGNISSEPSKPDKGLNVGQLVNHLSENLSGVGSHLQASTRQIVCRNNPLSSAKASHQMISSPLLTTTTLLPVKRAILNDNLIPKRIG